MRLDDGGGSTILIDPGSLKASAGRIKSAASELSVVQSRLYDTAVPSLPPTVAGVVSDALTTATGALAGDPELLDGNVTELTRRAFWAEFADRIMGGYTLTGTDRAEFVAWMKDGTLMQYADDYDATAAGMELAHVYSGFKDDPQQLIDLAACLRGAQEYAPVDLQRAFGAGFVNEFGAKNMLLVPRVLQAVEYSRSIGSLMSPSDDPFLLQDVAAKNTGMQLHQNPLDLMAAFSMTLANATYSGQLTRQNEDDIVNSPDTFATAALVSSGTFSKEFLLKVFNHDVVDRIVTDSRSYSTAGDIMNLQHDSPYTLGRLYTEGKGGLPYDTKEIVLDALARNPAAAQAALMQHLSVEPYDRYGEQQTVSNPIDLLYHYGHFQDNGSAFGRAYASAADQMNATPATKAEATQLTQHALALMLGGDDGMGGFKDGVATDVAHNHMPDLFEAARLHGAGGPDVVEVDGGHLYPSAAASIEILKSLGDQPSALQTVLHAAAAEQASIVHNGVANAPNGSTAWAYKAGAFDAQVLSAADLGRVDDFNAADERHKMIVGFISNVLDDTVSIDNPVLGAAAHTGIDSLVDNAFPSPEAEDTIMHNFDAKAFIQNSLHAQVVAAYHDHGDVAAPKILQTDDGRLVSYASTSGDQRIHYDSYLHGNEVDAVTRNAYNEIDQAFNDNSVDLFR